MIGSLLGRTRWLIRGKSTTAAVLQTTVLQVVTLIANLGTGILVARILAPSGRGELAAINLIPSLVAFASTLGIPAALLYNLRRDRQEAPTLIGAAIVSLCVLGTAGIAIGFAIMPYALHQYSPHVVALARLFLLTAPLALFTYISTSVFDSTGNFWYANSTRFLSPIVTLASLCTFWATGRLDVLTAATSYALPSLPIGIKMLVDVVRQSHPVFFPAARDAYAKLFSYGIRSFGVDLLSTIGQQIDQVLVVTFLSPRAMGLYAVALAVSRILQIFQSAVVRVLLPRIAARPIEEVTFAVGRAARITAALTAPMCLAVVVLAPFLLRLVYGGAFAGASSVLRVLAVEALFAGATWIFAQAFLALGKPGTVAGFQAIGLALTFPLMLILIPRFGLVGAGYALLASTLLRFALVLASFPWLLRARLPGVLLTSSDIASLKLRLRPKNDADGPVS